MSDRISPPIASRTNYIRIIHIRIIETRTNRIIVEIEIRSVEIIIDVDSAASRSG
jgi:hypothetical protein